ncbi:MULTISPECIES: MFS transporter [Alphaproteobacteria]|uniref:MFS transporter n=2 Tax=Alphaproteobacteria TaxID=28211 RepID=A0A512HL60_9HYPH|nr:MULTISPECIES: MFS transporter [Alphaproteobacteria]GEO86181.1 MFS transporter [Ciceribacter naphthalenivorans]GLR22748.1 MFS transporter [Ciceribacter naphthalenivorans]GLT05604.1 MFS transporter [Sphingomonas psychrolutea]
MAETINGSGGSLRNGYFTRTRAGVSLLFFVNGLMMGAWAPKIPFFAKALSLSEANLGVMLFVFGMGSLLLMPIAGLQIARFGSSRVVQMAALLFIPTIVGITLVESLWAGTIAIFLFGGLSGAMDVAMNANAVEVERSMRRSIMSSCHAFWSLGGLVGAATGGLLIAVIGPLAHALLVAGVALILLAIARPMILVDRPHPSERRQRARLPLTPLPWLIGMIALFSMIPEGAILDWGALYLGNELSASTAHSGFAFAAFSLAMAAMRFAGDLVRDRLGAVATLRLCTAASFVGLIVAGQAPNVTLALIGFGIAGIGISNMVPIAFSAGGNIPGLAPGIGLSVVTSLGYSGILFAPSVIGFIAEYTSLSAVYTAVSLLNLVVLALSGLARHADRAGAT